MITVVLCTAGARASLDNCLESLQKLTGDNHEVLVVENRAKSLLSASDLESWGARLLHEPRRGLDIARNRGMAEAKGEIVAYIDDDCEADQDWLLEFQRAFDDESVAFATGRVLAYSIELRSERCFEGRFSFDRGDLPKRFNVTSIGWTDIVPSYVGIGCNMAFRRQVLIEIGGFDEALDMGTLVPGGGDIDIFRRLLRAGYAASYVPEALMRHHHRTTMPGVTRQFWGYGVSQGAIASKAWRTAANQRGSTIACWLTAVRHKTIAVARRLLSPKDPPWWLLAVELAGVVSGPVLYPLSALRARWVARG